MITKEKLIEMQSFSGSPKEKNRLLELNLLLDDIDPIELIKCLDNLLEQLFFLNSEAELAGRCPMTAREVNEHNYNVKLIKNMLFNIYDFEDSLNMDPDYYNRRLKANSIKQVVS